MLLATIIYCFSGRSCLISSVDFSYLSYLSDVGIPMSPFPPTLSSESINCPYFRLVVYKSVSLAEIIILNFRHTSLAAYWTSICIFQATQSQHI